MMSGLCLKRQNLVMKNVNGKSPSSANSRKTNVNKWRNNLKLSSFNSSENIIKKDD